MVSRYMFLTMPNLMNNFIFESDVKMTCESKMAAKIDDFGFKNQLKYIF